jgi:hypothetical protein
MTTTTPQATRGLPAMVRINAVLTGLTILFALLAWARGGGNVFTVVLVVVCVASLVLNVARLAQTPAGPTRRSE